MPRSQPTNYLAGDAARIPMKFAFKVYSAANVLTKNNRILSEKTKKKKTNKQIIRLLQIFCVVEVFYQLLITVKVCDILERQPAAASRGKKNKRRPT